MVLDPIHDLTFELLSCLSLFDDSIEAHHFTDRGERERNWLLPSREALDQALEVIEWCRENNAQILYPHHPDYPAQFFDLEHPPLFLSCFHEVGLHPWKRTCFSAVGGREPSVRAIEWMEQNLSRFLKDRRATLVSGGARGIDQKAHSLSLRAGQSTIAVLPAGLAHIYPQDFRDWVPGILQSGGAILSPYAPHQEVRRYHFEGRNRLIAALGEVLLVVEARRRSGSVMTARLAIELGRTLAAVPSFPGEAQSSGSLDLLFCGGLMIRDTEDLITLFDLSCAKRAEG